MSTEVEAALARAEALQVDLGSVIADLRVALRHFADERPIPIKRAADKYGTSDKSMQRFARAGGGIKIANKWHVYESRITLTPVR